MLRKMPFISIGGSSHDMALLRRQLRRDSRQSTPTALARTARRGSLDDSRILTFIDLSGNVVGVAATVGFAVGTAVKVAFAFVMIAVFAAAFLF